MYSTHNLCLCFLIRVLSCYFFILFLKCSFFSYTFPNIFLDLSITFLIRNTFCYQQHLSCLTRPLLLHCDYCTSASFVSLSSDYQVAPSLTRFQQKLGDATGNWHSGDIMSGTFPGNRSDLVEKIDRSGPFWWKRSWFTEWRRSQQVMVASCGASSALSCAGSILQSKI